MFRPKFSEVGVQVLCYQWKNNYLVINPPCLLKVLKSKRAVRVLVKLLPLFDKGLTIQTSYSKLAKELGYYNRGGSYKAIKSLERLGVVKYKNGYLSLTMGNGVLMTYDEE